VNDLRQTLGKSKPCQNREPVVLAQNAVRQLFSGGKHKMHARPQVKELLIARKLQRWSAIAKCPLIDLRCPPARARKNYQRLFYRYRGIAEKIGLHEWSAF
jgi:hypothetical protein